MRVIMTGGGTGGHIYPAIAIADKIKEKHPDAEILFVGTERGLEKKLVPQSGYPIKFITVTGFNRKNLFKNLKVLSNLRKGFKEAKAILQEFKPDVVIGTGGYVCGPVVKMANSLKIRTFIHEQNAFPGLTNKLLESYAEKVFVAFAEAKSKFKNQSKLVVSGNPIRKDFFDVAKAECRAKFGISDNDFVILSFGGSQGAAKINEVMTSALEKLSYDEKNVIFFVTGASYYDKILEKVKEQNINLNDKIHILPYIDDMAKCFVACDLVISRAGALAVSEIMACGKPAILIPSPHVASNHQFFNAKALVVKGGAVMIEEKDLDADKLVETILALRDDAGMLEKMAIASKNAMESDAAEIIYSELGLDESEAYAYHKKNNQR